MNIKFQNKPGEELVDKYRKKLEKFLSAHNISISINLWDSPLRIESYVNGDLDEIKNIWIEKIVIESSQFGKLPVCLFNNGIDESLDEQELWRDAYNIQDQIYKKLKLTHMFPGELGWENDPYWKLWNFNPNKIK